MSNQESNNISLGRIIAFTAIIAIAFANSYYLGDKFRLAEKPAEYTGVAFSVLAASLFAVVSILSDPSMIMPGGSRHAWVSAKEIQKELQQFNILFRWYLLTLGLLVASELVKHAEMVKFYWIWNVFLFFATSGFLVSLLIPGEFARIQRRRLQQAINNRKANPDNTPKENDA